MFSVCFKGVFYQVRWEKLGEAWKSVQSLLFLSTYHSVTLYLRVTVHIMKLYRVSFNSLRTLWALLNIKNEGKCSSKSYRFKEEGCDFHSQLLFFSYVEANVFYSPWHLKLLKHEIRSWSYICPSVNKIKIHPTVSLFWLYAHSCVIAQKLSQNT